MFVDSSTAATSCQDGMNNKIRSDKRRASKSDISSVALIDDDEDNVESSCPVDSMAAPPIPKKNQPPETLATPEKPQLQPKLGTLGDDNNNGCKPEHPIRLCSRGKPTSRSSDTGYWTLVWDCDPCGCIFCIRSPRQIPDGSQL